MESHVINRIRRHLLLLAIFWKVCVINRIRRQCFCWLYFPMESQIVLEDIYCCWLYFPMEILCNKSLEYICYRWLYFPWKLM